MLAVCSVRAFLDHLVGPGKSVSDTDDPVATITFLEHSGVADEQRGLQSETI